MKILHVIHQLWRGNGAAKVVRDLAAYQIAQGNSVSIVSLSLFAPTFDQELEALGGEVIYLENRRYSRYHPKFFFRLRKIIKEYEIVHVHLFPALYWVALAKLFSSASCKLVLTEHSSFNNRQSIKLLNPLERFIYTRYDAVIGVSDDVSRMLRSRFGLKERLYTINNGVGIEEVRSAPVARRESLGIPKEAVLIVQVARFYEQKDQKTVIRMLTQLPDSFYLFFVGEGSLLEEDKALARSLGVSDRVIFGGFRNDAVSILKAADIVVMSSRFEGLCLSVLEAMAAGKPVVASNVEGLSQVVEGAGLLFELHDEKGLAVHVKRLMEDQSFYESVAERCRQRSLCFSSDTMAESYQQVYKELLK